MTASTGDAAAGCCVSTIGGRGAGKAESIAGTGAVGLCIVGTDEGRGRSASGGVTARAKRVREGVVRGGVEEDPSETANSMAGFGRVRKGIAGAGDGALSVKRSVCRDCKVAWRRRRYPLRGVDVSPVKMFSLAPYARSDWEYAEGTCISANETASRHGYCKDVRNADERRSSGIAAICRVADPRMSDMK